MLKKVLLGLGILLGAVLIYAAVKPADYFIKREIVINKHAEAIFPYLASMKKADEWMPWKEADPHVKNTYSGPEAGIGSVSSWESTGQMGVGKAEVIAAIPNEKITTAITYTKPMEMNQISEFILTPQGGSTKMEWNVKGHNSFLFRLIGIVMCMDVDKYVGGEFEKGLNKLKNIIEGKQQ